jgi:succinate-semialdehyde dehydrogenase/glutarate-semialdehyde dehydrogenase
MQSSIPVDMLIDGEWVSSSDGQRVDVENPATEEVVCSVPRATGADLDRALAAAASGWETWRRTDAWTRSAVLREAARILAGRADEVARVLTEEQGKPIAEARAELASAVEQLDWYADEARRVYGRVVPASVAHQRMLVLREPVGPVAAFTPWNFPALLSARKIAPALAAGCSMILKPAEEAPRSVLAIAQALVEAGLPAGVLNVVTGDPGQISAHLLASPVIRKVSLTGSVAVGQQLLRAGAENILDVSMELGGHAPVLVFPDVDAEAAGAACAKGKFRNAGQVCISATRFYVHESIIDRFTAAFVEQTRRLRIGNGLDPATDLGPLSNRRRVDAVESLVADAVDRGARLLTGGHRPTGRGFFFEPTVLGEVPPDSQVMHVEPFGPLAPTAPFSDLEEGLRLANSTPYGLAGYVFTHDLDTAVRAYEGLEVGMVGVNGFAVSGAQVPFGGVKRSGIGSENGTEAMDAYTVSKTVAMSLL